MNKVDRPLPADSKAARRQYQLAVKQGFDYTAAFISLILCAPLFAVIAAAVKLDSKGPVFYTQERYTIHKRRFRILKFRTMVPDAERYGPQIAAVHDRRVTRVGRFLRRFHLDELPQLVNILRGEVSFVGPRPERPVYADVYSQTVADYDLRYTFKAGLTGLAQIRGNYRTQPSEKAVFDSLYIREFSIWLDVKLMLLTPIAVLSADIADGVPEKDVRAVPHRQGL